MQTKTKVIIGIVALLVILLIAYFIYKYASKSPTTQTSTTTNTTSGSGGLTDLLSSLGGSGWFSGLFGGGNNNCSDNYTQCVINKATKDCDGVPCSQNWGNDCYNGCKSSMVGYDCNGNLSSKC